MCSEGTLRTQNKSRLQRRFNKNDVFRSLNSSSIFTQRINPGTGHYCAIIGGNLLMATLIGGAAA